MLVAFFARCSQLSLFLALVLVCVLVLERQGPGIFCILTGWVATGAKKMRGNDEAELTRISQAQS